jgi:isopenicillin-N epimerase
MGKAMRVLQFQLDNTAASSSSNNNNKDSKTCSSSANLAWSFVNHGSYGAVPQAVARYHSRYLQTVERNPDMHFRVRSFPEQRAVLCDVAKFCGVADPDALVFVRNATSACNTVVHSIELEQNDAMITLSCVYNAVRQSMQRHCAKHGATYIELDMPAVPLHSATQIVDVVRSFFEDNKQQQQHKNKKIKLAMLDHIASGYGFELPLEELTDLFHAHGVPVCVDGAHCIGQIPNLNLDALHCDYYCSNLHKWGMSPKSSALLYTRDVKRRATLHPLVTSHERNNADYRRRFWMQGTSDETPSLSARAGLRFLQCIGLERAHAYRMQLRADVLALVTKRWNRLDDIKDEAASRLIAPLSMNYYLTVLRLPKRLPVALHRTLQLDLLNRHCIVLPIGRFGDALYCRFSFQVYNFVDEYRRIADVLATYEIPTTAATTTTLSA